MSQPDRQVYYNVANSLQEDLIKKLKSRKDFTNKKFLPDSDNCHFIRYSFLFGGEKVSIVFDTKAELLTVTAFNDAIAIIDGVFSDLRNKFLKKQSKIQKSDKSAKKASSKETDSVQEKKTEFLIDLAKPSKSKTSGVAKKLNTYASNERATENPVEKYYVAYNYNDMQKARLGTTVEPAPLLTNRTVSGLLNNNENSTKKSDVNENEKLLNASKTSSATSFKQEQNEKENKHPQKSTDKNLGKVEKKSPQKNQSKPQQSDNSAKKNGTDNKKTSQENSPPEQKAEAIEYKDGYSVRKPNNEKVKSVIDELNKISAYKVSAMGTVKSTSGDITTYSIESTNRQKVYLRNIVKKNMLQLQGRRSELFSEIQILISRDDQATPSKNTSDKHQQTVYKEVKKALPYAFDYLSEQSKIDFTIGLIDIYNEDVRLSDYSVLLVPPYRGLERFLFDLQKAKNIEVKMIGQAFEKDGGNYTLKNGYRKKIDSIVFNEVMSALYTEYFEKRNFYAHSNNTDEISARVIGEKSQAKAIFDNLLKLINYNCKKLAEIGFSKNKA